jgi:hypothetical protein
VSSMSPSFASESKGANEQDGGAGKTMEL